MLGKDRATDDEIVAAYTRLGTMRRVMDALHVGDRRIRSVLNSRGIATRLPNGIVDKNLLATTLDKADGTAQLEMAKMLDNFEERFRRSSAIPFKVPRPNKKRGRVTDEEMNLALNDIHYGGIQAFNDTLGLCEYSPKIAEKRMETLVERFYLMYDLFGKAYVFKRLNVLLLGDLVDGEAIWDNKPGGTFYLAKDGADQLFGCFDLLTRLFAELGANFSSVRVYAMYGNHGRARNLGTPRYNLDYFIARMLQAKFAGTHISVYPMDTWFAMFEIAKKLVFAQHGDQTKAWGTYPMYGITRDTLKQVAITGKVPDVVCLAHFHERHNFDISRIEVIQNGAFCGGTSYALRVIKTISAPKQELWGMHPKVGITWRTPLYLGTIPKMQPDSAGIYTPYHKG